MNVGLLSIFVGLTWCNSGGHHYLSVCPGSVIQRVLTEWRSSWRNCSTRTCCHSASGWRSVPPPLLHIQHIYLSHDSSSGPVSCCKFQFCVSFHAEAARVKSSCRTDVSRGEHPVLICHLVCMCVCFSPGKLQKKSCYSVTCEFTHVGVSSHSFSTCDIFSPRVCLQETLCGFDEVHSDHDRGSTVHLVRQIRLNLPSSSKNFNQKRDGGADKRTVFVFTSDRLKRVSMFQESFTVAVTAVGSVLQLVDKVMTSELRNGFALVRWHLSAASWREQNHLDNCVSHSTCSVVGMILPWNPTLFQLFK